jgi:hypothetical protein
MHIKKIIIPIAARNCFANSKKSFKFREHLSMSVQHRRYLDMKLLEHRCDQLASSLIGQDLR